MSRTLDFRVAVLADDQLIPCTQAAAARFLGLERAQDYPDTQPENQGKYTLVPLLNSNVAVGFLVFCNVCWNYCGKHAGGLFNSAYIEHTCAAVAVQDEPPRQGPHGAGCECAADDLRNSRPCNLT
jgi:hypothetical protein